MRTTSDTIAAIGLAIGGALGLAGTFLASAPLRETAWTIDGGALATALLAMKYRRGWAMIAPPRLPDAFLAGESLLLAGNATGWRSACLPMSTASRSIRRLAMVSAPKTFALWMRLTALVAAVLFVVAAGMILWRAPLLPNSAPLPAAGYPLLVLTFVGWVWMLVRDGR